MITQSPFGYAPDGSPLSLFTLKNAGGMEVRVTNYGGIVTHLFAPDRDGKLANVVLGFDKAQDYFNRSPYFGALIGRCANRIARGRFTLDGQTHQLTVNDGENHLHGGTRGFDQVVWDARIDGKSLVLQYRSPDGDQGYPGNLVATAIFTLSEDNELSLRLSATTDRATPVNLTHHGYFNLAGGGTIVDHELTLDAGHYTPVDRQLIPLGHQEPVNGTGFDFRSARRIGEAIGEEGYDHNFVLTPVVGMRRAARVHEPVSGRVMDVFTHEPGIQFYSGNFLDGSLGFPRRGGFCLEPQHFPNSPNEPGFPSVILRPGQTYENLMRFRFSVYRNRY